MTEQNSAAVEVTQPDREAAASRADRLGLPTIAKGMRAGQYDGCENVQDFARHRLASTPSPVAAVPVGEVDELRHKLRMIVSHATGGASQDIDCSVNDICVAISANRNLVYQAGKGTREGFRHVGTTVAGGVFWNRQEAEKWLPDGTKIFVQSALSNEEGA